MVAGCPRVCGENTRVSCRKCALLSGTAVQFWSCLLGEIHIVDRVRTAISTSSTPGSSRSVAATYPQLRVTDYANYA